MRIFLALVAALLCVGTLRAEEASDKRFEKLPEEVAVAVTEKWGVRALAERLRKRDSTDGCVDAFWELLALCDNKPEARKDSAIEAVLGWIVLESRTTASHEFNDPVYIRIPRLFPELGKKVLKKRLAAWAAGGFVTHRQDAPWQWAEIQKIDAGLMRAAMREVYDDAKKHNPGQHFLLAVALLSVGDAEAKNAFNDARENMLRNFEMQGLVQIADTLLLAARQGMKPALPLLADIGAQLAAQTTLTELREPKGRALSRVMDGLRSMLHWPPAKDEFNSRYRERQTVDWNFEPLQKWLAIYLDKLQWDVARSRYVGDAPPPGQEKLYAAVRALKEKYGIDWLASEVIKPLPEQIVKWAEENKAAAADPLAADLLSEVLELEQYRDWLWERPLHSRLGILPAIAEDFTQRVVLASVKNRLDAMDVKLEGARDLLRGENRGAAEKAMLVLVPEYTRQFEEALNDKKSEAALLAFMRVMVCGGSAPRERAIEAFAGAPDAWRASNGQLYRWWNQLLDLKRKNCMLYLLQWGAADLKQAEKDNEGRSQPLQIFIGFMSWKRGEDVPDVSAEQLLAYCEEWYARNEAALVFSTTRSGFEPVPSPRRQELLDALKPLVEKYKVNIEHLLNPPKRGNYLTENARQAWEDLAALPSAMPELLKDADYRKAVEAMARLFSKTGSYPHKMMPILSQLESPLAKELIMGTLRKAVAHARTAKHIHMMSNASRNLQELHPPLVRAVQDEVANELRAEPMPASALDRLQRTYILAALNQPQPAEDLRTRFKEAGVAGFDQLNSGEAFQVIARLGNPGVHRLFLVAARMLPERRAQLLRQFEVLGLGLGKRGFVTAEQDEAFLARYETWLDANEATIVWNAEMRRYEGRKPETSLESLAPATDGKSGKNGAVR